MKQRLLFILLVIGAVGCQAKFGTAEKEGTPVDENPKPPDPKPETGWPGGFIQLRCKLQHKKKEFGVAQVGMLNAGGTEFSGQTYTVTPFYCDDELRAWAYFTEHDPAETPIAKPKKVHFWYHIQVKPKWWKPDDFFEEKGDREIDFELGNGFEVDWEFSKAKLTCSVETPQ